ncbi:MAG: guanylate kinase [Syntrophomonas sp.]
MYIISGPSGVGKGTLKKALMDRISDLQLSISVTTRQPRDGEIEGKHYFFKERAAFQQMIDRDEFLEWAQVYSHMYGTPRDFVLANINRGQDVLLEIDIQGALQVKQKMPSGVFIFISPPNPEELANRLALRGQDSCESMEIRLAASEDELKQIENYDYLIINDDLEEALNKIQSIIIAERCKIKNMDLG